MIQRKGVILHGLFLLFLVGQLSAMHYMKTDPIFDTVAVAISLLLLIRSISEMSGAVVVAIVCAVTLVFPLTIMGAISYASIGEVTVVENLDRATLIQLLLPTLGATFIFNLIRRFK